MNNQDSFEELTVIICTMNRPDSLTSAINSLLDGECLPGEIIIGNDGDFDALPRVKHQKIRYVDSPKRGLSANRNHCLQSVSTDFLCFIDDDVIAPSDFVKNIKKLATPGRIVTGWELNFQTSAPRKVGPSNSSFLGFQKIKPINHLESIVMNATVFPTGLFDLAQFDEFTRYGFEEIDMARHATALGFEISQKDELWVSHYPSPLNRDLYAQNIFQARLYLTAKAYLCYEGNWAKTLLFFIVAPLHHIVHCIFRSKPLVPALGASISTIRTFVRDVRNGRLKTVEKKSKG